MKKMIFLALVMVFTVGNLYAIPLDPYNTRPVTIGTGPANENSLQTELNNVFGSGVVDAYTDQLDTGMFKVAVPGSNLIAPQFKFEWTGNSNSQTIGIFGWDGTSAVKSQIFSGAQQAGDFATIVWSDDTNGSITSFASGTPSTNAFSGIDRDFFGFYFEVGNNTYYSVDSLNPNSAARVLGYMPTLSGALFSYEDGTDWDYNDAGFFVESIKPVPEPGTLLLLGSGLAGLALYRRRSMNK